MIIVYVALGRAAEPNRWSTANSNSQPTTSSQRERERDRDMSQGRTQTTGTLILDIGPTASMVARGGDHSRFQYDTSAGTGSRAVARSVGISDETSPSALEEGLDASARLPLSQRDNLGQVEVDEKPPNEPR